MKKINLFMSFKQQLLVNNINMSTSLPKIKTLAQQSETGSQKQLKFKKLKLNTDQSAADIREKFKSVRTERLSSLQRYSTVEGQREHKKQKIHLNLLQRKLMSGTYDEKQQTGNDLNFLKQKTDLYKTQWTQRQLQTEKVRQMIEEIKVEIQNYQIIKQKNDEAVAKVQRKFDQQKLKTEAALSEKSCLQHMISERKKVNHFVESKINEDKAYLTKLKAIVKQVFTQARQSTESMKNLMLKIDKINDEALRQQRSREQIMYEKQSVINRRKDDEKLRELKSKQFKKTLDQGELELEKKDFMDLYKGILSHVFLQKYCRQTMQSLQQKYQVMENYYEKISSYKKFQSNQPNLMIERYKNLNPETADLEDKIKKLEQKQLQLENKNSKLSDKLKEVNIIGNKNQEQNLKLIRNKSEIIEKQEIKQKEHERKMQNVKQEIDEINETVHKVERWGDRYAKQFEIKSRRSQDPEELGRNIVNIIKVVLKQSQGLDKKKTKTQQIEQK